jgi:hypothetical protein
MNSKLRNSFSAIAASGAALAIALMTAMPATKSPVLDVALQAPPAAAAAAKAAAGLDPAARHLESLADAVATSASALAMEAGHDMDAANPTRLPSKGSRHRRQTLVMPYFSFSPRG